MTRRTHACLGCADSPGDTPFNRPRRTRHKNRVCSLCRRRGVTNRDGVLTIPVELVLEAADLNYRGARGA